MTFSIAYACNDNYACQTVVSMVSLFENNRAQDMILYLIEDHMSRKNIALAKQAAAAYGKELRIVPLGQLLEGDLKSDGRHPATVYAKLFLHRICAAERILYLDSDTVVVGPLQPLWEMDFAEDLIAGVQMPYSAELKKRLGLGVHDSYVCDGVLYIHLKKWREQHMEQRCMEWIHSQNGKPLMCSEGVVNAVAKKKVRLLPPQYNLMSSMLLWNSGQIRRLYLVADYYTEQELEQARERPVVIHYLEELYIRPWFANSDHPLKNVYVYYWKRAGFSAGRRTADGKLALRTKAVRFLNASLPFDLFLRIYRIAKRQELRDGKKLFKHRGAD